MLMFLKIFFCKVGNIWPTTTTTLLLHYCEQKVGLGVWSLTLFLCVCLNMSGEPVFYDFFFFYWSKVATNGGHWGSGTCLMFWFWYWRVFHLSVTPSLAQSQCFISLNENHNACSFPCQRGPKGGSLWTLCMPRLENCWCAEITHGPLPCWRKALGHWRQLIDRKLIYMYDFLSWFLKVTVHTHIQRYKTVLTFYSSPSFIFTGFIFIPEDLKMITVLVCLFFFFFWIVCHTWSAFSFPDP